MQSAHENRLLRSLCCPTATNSLAMTNAKSLLFLSKAAAMVHGGYVYIITNKNHTTLYTGVTSGIARRMKQHRTKFYKNSFSARYNLEKLVYYEKFPGIEEAISREKQIKAGSRKKKEALINSINPSWEDLYDSMW